MALQAVTPYCTRQDIEDRLSEQGVVLRADHNQDGVLDDSEVRVITHAITDASETINPWICSFSDSNCSCLGTP